MSGGIFLVSEGSLVEMSEERYDTEDVLQSLLEDYPNLLAGDQIDGASPRRWLLLGREMPLASEENGSGRWSVDHLFVDQDAVPTIVEVKRSTDTRIRREVVGQMLDYAANGVMYWPVGDLRGRLEDSPESEGEIERLLRDPEADVEAFWERLDTNLKAGRVRMIFVSDSVPAELRRIVEFLNAQMDPAEVLAVEIKQYVGRNGSSDLKTLVPRVIGQTEGAKQHKTSKTSSRRPSVQWDEASFFEDLRTRAPETEKAATAILDWARREGLDLRWSGGSTYGIANLTVESEGEKHQILSCWSDGNNAIWFKDLSSFPVFSDREKQLEFLQRLNALPGVEFTEKHLEKYPCLPKPPLANDDVVSGLIDCLDWALDEIRIEIEM